MWDGSIVLHAWLVSNVKGAFVTSMYMYMTLISRCQVWKNCPCESTSTWESTTTYKLKRWERVRQSTSKCCNHWAGIILITTRFNNACKFIGSFTSSNEIIGIPKVPFVYKACCNGVSSIKPPKKNTLRKSLWIIKTVRWNSIILIESIWYISVGNVCGKLWSHLKAVKSSRNYAYSFNTSVNWSFPMHIPMIWVYSNLYEIWTHPYHSLGMYSM